jgi:hypothetical protein
MKTVYIQACALAGREEQQGGRRSREGGAPWLDTESPAEKNMTQHYTPWLAAGDLLE